MIVKPTDTESEWLINRWFYFDEQVEAYMWNFAEKICTDAKYRQQSLEETEEWKRVANLYEPLARRLYQELSYSERSEFPIMNDRSRDDSEKLKSLLKSCLRRSEQSCDKERTTIRRQSLTSSSGFTRRNPEREYWRFQVSHSHSHPHRTPSQCESEGLVAV